MSDTRMPLCLCGHEWALHVIPGGVGNIDIYPKERWCVDCRCRDYRRSEEPTLRATGEGARDEVDRGRQENDHVDGESRNRMGSEPAGRVDAELREAGRGRAKADRVVQTEHEAVPNTRRETDGPVAVSLDPHRLLDELLAFVDEHVTAGQGAKRDEFYRGWRAACHNVRNKIQELARLRGEATVRVEDDVCVYCREPRAKHTKEGRCVARFVNMPASLEDQPR